MANSQPLTTNPILCKVFLDSPGEAQENMDLDRALFSARKPALRIYGWRRRAVSLGYFQKQEEVRGSLPHDWKEAPMVVRPTGGGAVLHTEEETTFCLVLPSAALGNPLSSYRTIHEAVQRALLRLGIRTEWAPQSSAGSLCFLAPVAGDLLLGGQKIVGGAQRRSHGWLLHQGSIQLPILPCGFRIVNLGCGRDSVPAVSDAEDGVPPNGQTSYFGLRQALAEELVKQLHLCHT